MKTEHVVFFLTVFIAGLCSIVYELLISTTSSYFLGDSVKQFSLTIGIYMAAMGLGSYLTKFLKDDLIDWFVRIEVMLGIVGGASVPILYFVFDWLSTEEYQFIMFSLTALIGVLTGFEIPILVRVLKSYYPLKSNLAYVLSLDYVGALVATLLFPFLLLPFVGTFKTSLIFGLVNIALGFLIYRFFTKEFNLKRKKSIEALAFVSLISFSLLAFFSNKLLNHWEDNFFTSKIVYTEQTPYQNLVLTKNKEDLRLYINRIIQFSSMDEYRYHEALALVPMQAAPYHENVLILGGGEGLLAREVLKHSKVKSITIVDLDAAVFDIGKNNVWLKKLNEGALTNPKVKLVSEDAFTFIKNTNQKFDIILSDLPDPSNESLARLYSDAFFKLAQSKLTGHGVFATQASSPFHTKKAYWCAFETLKSSGFEHVYPYHCYVPSFGEWGFHIASQWPLEPANFEPQFQYKFLESTTVRNMFHFEKDIMNPGGILPNQLDQPTILDYFLEDWEKWRKEKKS